MRDIFDGHKLQSRPGNSSAKPRFDAAVITIPGWRTHKIGQTQIYDGIHSQLSLWVSNDTERYSSNIAVAAIEVFETPSVEEAKRLALQMANDCQIGVTMHGATALGDVSYVGPRDMPVLFARGQFTVRIMQAERLEVPALDIARKVDTHLTQLTEHS